MNVVLEMTALSISRPAADSPVESVAAWYEAKARLHEHLAALGDTDHARERMLAASAHERSLSLLRSAA